MVRSRPGEQDVYKRQGHLILGYGRRRQFIIEDVPQPGEVADLLKAGASVALLGRTRSKLEDLQRKLAEEGLARTLVLAADVLDKAALEQACSRVKAEWGRLDILVNGAGGNDPRGTSPAERGV